MTRHRPGCARRVLVIRALVAVMLLAIAALAVFRAARHPVWHARYLAGRRRRVPRLDPDGTPLTPGEVRQFAAVIRGWKHDGHDERSRT